MRRRVSRLTRPKDVATKPWRAYGWPPPSAPSRAANPDWRDAVHALLTDALSSAHLRDIRRHLRGDLWATWHVTLADGTRLMLTVGVDTTAVREEEL